MDVAAQASLPHGEVRRSGADAHSTRIQDLIVAELEAAEQHLARSHREAVRLLAAHLAAIDPARHEQTEHPPCVRGAVPGGFSHAVPEGTLSSLRSQCGLGKILREHPASPERCFSHPTCPRPLIRFQKDEDPPVIARDAPVRPNDAAIAATLTTQQSPMCGAGGPVGLNVEEAIGEHARSSTRGNGIFQRVVESLLEEGDIVARNGAHGVIGHSVMTGHSPETARRPDGSQVGLEVPFWIVHPHANSRALWDTIGLLLVVYDLFSIPFMFFDPPEEGVLAVMAWVTRFFWSADMPASLVTGFVLNDGNIELQPRSICIRYVQTWFLLDAFVVGIDWAELLLRGTFTQIAGFGRASRVIRVLRMLRLLRLVRMREVMTAFTERLNSDSIIIFIDIVKILATIMAIAHVIACLWYLVSDTVSGDNTWLVAYGYDVESGKTTLEERYCMSFHWALVQFAGGMDEVTPQNLNERIYAIVAFVMAFMMSAAFISSLTSSMTKLYLISSKQTQQFMVLRRFLAQGGISERLAIRVRRNAQHAHEEHQRNMSEDAVEMLRLVSDPLRMEIHFELYREEISVHPFFCRFIREGSQVMRHVCHQALQFSIVASGDIIFNSGENPSRPKMYFVCRGDLQYKSFAGLEAMVRAGQWLAEGTLWTTWVHLGVLMAKSDCRLCLLDAQIFRQVVGQFEAPGVDMDAYKEDFLARLERLVQCNKASDLHFPPEEGDSSVTLFRGAKPTSRFGSRSRALAAFVR